MRHRSGKGFVIAFDAALENRMEELKKGLGFYPTLRELGASFSPPLSADFIFRSLRRLADAGRLSEEARQVYDSKNNKKGKTNENVKTVKQVKKARRA